MRNIKKFTIWACLDEIEAAIRLAKKPLTRKSYLNVRKWYNYQKETLQKIAYSKKIKPLPKHTILKEIKNEN